MLLANPFKIRFPIRVVPTDDEACLRMISFVDPGIHRVDKIGKRLFSLWRKPFPMLDKALLHQVIKTVPTVQRLELKTG